MISQELFDETVLENEEIFELNPEEALQETMDQLTKQHQQLEQQKQQQQQPQQPQLDFLNHLCLLHPHSSSGKHERLKRHQFVQWCDTLDTCIQSDGTVVTTTTTTTVEALQGIQNYCNPRNPQQKAYLYLFQQQESIYSLMSLLGVMSSSSSSSNNNNNNDKDNHGEVVDQEDDSIIHTTRETILQETLKTLTLLLGAIPPLRDSFVAWERWTELFQLFMVKDDEKKKKKWWGIVTELLRLAHIACLHCEPNKVNWMKTCRHRHRDSNTAAGGGIGLVLKCLKYSPKDNNDNDDNDKEEEEPRGGENVVEINNNNNTTTTIQIRMMIQACKLIIVLCRFDDFRDPSSVTSSASGQPSLSGAGLPTVSSAHDNVLELSREGTVPVLIHLLKTTTTTIRSKKTPIQSQSPELCTTLLQALRVLAIQDDIIQSMVAMGLLQIVQEITCTSLENVVSEQQEEDLITADTATLPSSPKEEEDTSRSTPPPPPPKSSLSSSANLVAAALGLMRNLSGNDDIKTTLCIGGGGGSGSPQTPSSSSSSPKTAAALPQILQAMKLYLHHTTIQQHGCGTLAAMALRRPSNVMEILSQNGHVAILGAMKSHPMNVAIQRQGSLALRNIVSRPLEGTTDNHHHHPNGTKDSDDLHSSFSSVNAKEMLLEAGAEHVLQNIAGAHQGSVDEAYAALRDLGIEGVKLCKVGSDGQLQSRVSSYNVEAVMAAAGQGMAATTTPKVSNFRPVFETSRVLDNL